MNKSDLVESVASSTGLNKTTTTRAVEAAFNAISEALIAGDTVTLIGFGVFSLVDRVAREGRNPQTGLAVSIPASRVAKFKPGKALKDAMKT